MTKKSAKIIRKDRKKVKKRGIGKILFRGDAALTLILAIVVLAGVFLVGGLLPAPDKTTTDLSSGAVIDEDSLSDSTSERSLQLKTVKFKKCASTVAVTMMLDRTGSMESDGKIEKLKTATLSFTSQMSDESVVGIQSFASNDSYVPNITNDVPVGYYKDVKSLIESKIPALDADGYTPTYHALQYARDILISEIPKYPDRKFSFIFLTDGKPNPATTEDPRDYSPNPATEIKNLGVTIFTIGIFGPADEAVGGDLLRSIASSPANYFATPTGDELANIYAEIGTKICSKSTGS